MSICLQQVGGRKSGIQGTNVVDIDLTTTSTWSTAHVPSHVATHVWRAEGAAEATTWSTIKSTTAWCAMDWCGEAWLGLAILTAHQSQIGQVERMVLTSRTYTSLPMSVWLLRVLTAC